MTQLNHERSTFKLKRDNERAYRYQARTARANAKKAMTRYAREHNIACFKCKSATNEVAKMDVDKRGRVWWICVPCVKANKRKTSGQ